MHLRVNVIAVWIMLMFFWLGGSVWAYALLIVLNTLTSNPDHKLLITIAKILETISPNSTGWTQLFNSMLL